jgi:hypothetical protein
MTDESIRERLARVEQRFEHFEYRQNAMVEMQSTMAKQVAEMYLGFQRGKVYAWIGLGLWSGILGIVSANLSSLVAYFRGH